jgi:hypothetical protein
MKNGQTIEREFEYELDKTYYYVGPRSAWDQVPIGLFRSKSEALFHVPFNCSDSIVKPASMGQVRTFFGIK